MAPRKVEGCARSGHVTGQRSLRGRGSRKGLQRAPTNTMLFSDYHLAKLNPNCHMNYSIIFTEISFSTTSSYYEKNFVPNSGPNFGGESYTRVRLIFE